MPVAPRRLARDEVLEFFETDPVVQGPGLGVGLVGAVTAKGGLFGVVEDAVGAHPQQVGRVIQAPQSLPGARGGPDAVDEALQAPVAFQIAADRAVPAATRGDGGELAQQAVDEQTAEAVAALAVGAVTGARLLQEGEDLGSRYAQGRTAGGHDDRGLIALEGGSSGEFVERFGPTIVLDAPPKDIGHALVGFHQPRRRCVGAQDVVVPQAGELDGVDVAGAQRGQDLADVVEEPLVGADHEDVLGQEVLVVHEPGDAVQADRGLAGARAALHDEDVGGEPVTRSIWSRRMVSTMSRMRPVRERWSSRRRNSSGCRGLRRWMRAMSKGVREGVCSGLSRSSASGRAGAWSGAASSAGALSVVMSSGADRGFGTAVDTGRRPAGARRGPPR